MDMAENREVSTSRWWQRLAPWQDAALVAIVTFAGGAIFLALGAVNWVPGNGTWLGLVLFVALGFLTRLGWLLWRRHRIARDRAAGKPDPREGMASLPRT